MDTVAYWCLLGDLSKVRAAIGRGEDVNDKTFHGNTGLMCALMKKHNSIMKLLLEQPLLDLNLTADDGRTALHFAALFDNVEGARMLLADPRLNTHNHKDKDIGWTPVMAAMCRNKANTLRELVAHPSVDLDTTDYQGSNLEDWARYELILLHVFFTKFN